MNRPTAFASVLLLVFGCAGAAWAVDLQTLVDRSPFSPPGSKVQAAPAEPLQLEFRGLTTDSSGTYFSVFDLTSNRGRWLRVGESLDNLSVRGYLAAEQMLEVEHNGRVLKLQLKRATIQTSAPAAGVAVAARPPAASGSINAQVNPADDARRLEAVAAEVRRRRALRNAVAQQAAAAQPAAAALVPPPSVPAEP